MRTPEEVEPGLLGDEPQADAEFGPAEPDRLGHSSMVVGRHRFAGFGWPLQQLVEALAGPGAGFSSRSSCRPSIRSRRPLRPAPSARGRDATPSSHRATRSRENPGPIASRTTASLAPGSSLRPRWTPAAWTRPLPNRSSAARLDLGEGDQADAGRAGHLGGEQSHRRVAARDHERVRGCRRGRRVDGNPIAMDPVVGDHPERSGLHGVEQRLETHLGSPEATGLAPRGPRPGRTLRLGPREAEQVLDPTAERRRQRQRRRGRWHQPPRLDRSDARPREAPSRAERAPPGSSRGGPSGREPCFPGSRSTRHDPASL